MTGGGAIGQGTHAVSGALTIETVEAQAAGLRGLEPMTHLTLDLSSVDYITAPGAQLLVACRKAQESAGGTLRIQASGAVADAIRLMGLQALLDERGEMQ